METSTDTRSKPSESATDGEASRGTSSDGATGTRRKLTDQQEAEVTRLYAQTDTPVSEISKRFGIGESSVYRVAQRHGAALRGRTATSATSTPRAASATPAAASTGRGTRGRAAGRPAASAGRATPAASTNGRRTGARAARAAATPARRTAPAAAATPRAAAGGARREFRVSFVAVRVFAAVDMADAIRQAEAAGATDITGIVRN
jgi:transposase-like protein